MRLQSIDPVSWGEAVEGRKVVRVRGHKDQTASNLSVEFSGGHTLEFSVFGPQCAACGQMTIIPRFLRPSEAKGKKTKEGPEGLGPEAEAFREVLAEGGSHPMSTLTESDPTPEAPPPQRLRINAQEILNRAERGAGRRMPVVVPTTPLSPPEEEVLSEEEMTVPGLTREQLEGLSMSDILTLRLQSPDPT